MLAQVETGSMAALPLRPAPARRPPGRPAAAEPQARRDGAMDRLIAAGGLPAEAMVFDDGAELFHEASESRYFFKVTAGVVRLSRLLADGRRQIAAFCLPGSFCGLDLRGSHGATAEAIGTVSVKRMSWHHLDALAVERPAANRAVLELLSEQLAEAHARLLLLGRKTPREKLASFLLEMADRSAGDGAAAGWFHLPMRRQDIADFLGLTIETVSRGFTRFRAAGLIALADPTTLRLLDREALEEIADGLCED